MTENARTMRQLRTVRLEPQEIGNTTAAVISQGNPARDGGNPLEDGYKVTAKPRIKSKLK